MQFVNGTLVLVADGAKMMAFRNDGDEKYPVLTTLTHRAADNPPSGEQGTDRPGRSFSSTGERRNTYEETDWHRQAEDRFAREALSEIERIASGENGGIVIIAPPRILGELRKHYGAATEPRVLAEIAKDLAQHTTDDIVAAITAHTP